MTNLKSFSSILSVVENTGNLLSEGVKIGEITGNSFRIPIEIFASAPETLEIMREFELYKPEKMIKFLAESFSEALGEIQSEIQDLKLRQSNKIVARIKGAKSIVQLSMDNTNYKKEKLEKVQDELIYLMKELEEEVREYIESVRKIDNKSRWKFFISATKSMETIDYNMKTIRVLLDAMEEAIAMQMLIAKELDMDINEAVIHPYYDFYDEILSGDTCRLLDAYEFRNRKKEQYFLRLGERKQNLKKFSDAYEKYEEYVDELDGYGDIVFD